MPKGKRLSTVNAKKDFLRKRPELWDAKGSKIRDAMADAGLCSKTTYPWDLQLNKTLEKLREEQIVGAAEEAARKAVASLHILFEVDE